MASLLAENWSCMNNNMDMNDHFPGAAGAGTSSNMSNALLMSLLEETQGDQDHDEERLRSLIRALEVELDPTTSEDHEIFMENPHQFGGISQEDFQPLDVGYVSGGDFPGTDAAGFGWIDMEIGSSSQEGTGESVDWYMDSCLDDEIDCSSSNFGGSTTTPFEENGYQNLWQETYINTRMNV
ncbi:hypothetical protein PRUPE_4G151500 [Prunus persica]|uniref:Uncharacterized protein n=1 Tax=Prunus persica TaxID=3760 RepID=M5WPJ5_PRUPE|nr:uncharacterized protein LOC18780163 [Prunus persica]ONI12213.1 hypothetical protein PRUPE_4G151500 [Prunus persica]